MNLIRQNSLFPLALSALLITAALSAAHGFADTVTAPARTAAELDWVQSGTRSQCRGEYVETKAATKDPSSTGKQGRVRAGATSILHVKDHSTTLEGEVEIVEGNQTLAADFATIDAETEQYTAEGNIRYRQPGLLLTGASISGSLFSGTAVIDSASFLLHQNRLRGTATSISRSADETLVIEAGEFTTCEPGNNTWAVAGENITLHTREGYGIARDVTLRVKDVPVAYFPYFRFPVDDRRQSGLLLPSIGSDSDGGTDIAIPWYFNLAPNYDATYTLRSLWKRGLMHEGEFRYLDSYGENTIAGAYLPSDDAWDPREVIDASRPADFGKEDRWLFHVSHRGSSGRWSSDVDYTSVSDIDYFHDLGGFTRTESTFSRSLDSTSSPALLRRGSLTYRGDAWRSMLELRSFQPLSQTGTRQYEVLPRISVEARQQLGPVNARALAQFTEFDIAQDGATTGSRAVIDTRLDRTFRKPWGYLKPAISLLYRDYNLDDQGTNTGSREDASLTTTSASIDAGLILERPTRWFGTNLVQTLEPRLSYFYIEEDFQDDLPQFDSTLITPSYENLFRGNRFTGYDRIGDANRLAVGISTSLVSPESGRKLVTASIGQSFHFEDRKVGRVVGLEDTADTSPLFLALETRTRHWSARAAWEFDSEANASNRGYLGLRYRREGAVFNFNYAMTADPQQRGFQRRPEEESDLSFQWPLGANWQLLGRWNYDWDNGQTIESLLGLEYNDCCWKARVVFRRNLDEPRLIALTTPGAGTRLVLDNRADSGIYFEFQLKGLASLGGRLDSLLQDSIPGFQTER